MDIRRKILLKPASVVHIIQIKMTQLGIDLDQESFNKRRDELAQAALRWWDEEILPTAQQDDPTVTEERLGQYAIDRMRNTETWGKILREGTN